MIQTINVPNYAFTEAPSGNVYYACPLCMIFCDKETNLIDGTKYRYCELCGIVFNPCCLILSRQQSDNIFTAQVINEFVDDNILYVNCMPCFESIGEANYCLPHMKTVFCCHKCSNKI